jgi:DNA segregation ATPase FtsK/SpoIIIE-like protein
MAQHSHKTLSPLSMLQLIDENIQNNEALIERLRSIENIIIALHGDILQLLDEYELPQMIAGIEGRIASGELKKVTTAWLQRTYRIGYARAAFVHEELCRRNIISS